VHAVTQTIPDAEVARIRAHVKHPIIDSDGHQNEFVPGFDERFVEAVGQVAGSGLRDEMAAAPDLRWYLMERTTPMGVAFGSSRRAAPTLEERRANGIPINAWGPPHGNALDKATALVPRLRHQRLEEIGIDYSVVYPSSGLAFPHIAPDELRQIACRALNIVNADAYRGLEDRLTPVAVIPMNTPAEAVAELEYAIGKLGLKVAMIGHVARPIPNLHREHPELFGSAFRIDAFGIDSDHDYDPFWAKCAELQVPLVAHGTSYGIGFRRSPTNYIYNQTTTFADAADLLCRALFLGGVTRRFPTLKFQFLECGVGWACVLYAELVHRWEKRNIGALRGYVAEAAASEAEFVRLLGEHGDAILRDNVSRLPTMNSQVGSAFGFDDFEAAEIESVQDVHDLFVPRFYFGCEADDPITPWAFNTRTNPLGARLRATLGSDMGHWDVPDMRGILPEAFEAVERGLIDEDDFRRFTFGHPCELFAGVNPNFFDGTAVEPYVAGALAG
jgi:predicted TIM-barrel fold metal-dependent hydrolase